MQNIDAVVTSALNSGEKTVLVTRDVIKGILRDKYKETDRYLIYRNVELHDYKLVDETARKNAMDIEEKVHGRKRPKRS